MQNRTYRKGQLLVKPSALTRLFHAVGFGIGGAIMAGTWDSTARGFLGDVALYAIVGMALFQVPANLPRKPASWRGLRTATLYCLGGGSLAAVLLANWWPIGRSLVFGGGLFMACIFAWLPVAALDRSKLIRKR